MRDREPGAGPADRAAERGRVIRGVRPDHDQPAAAGMILCKTAWLGDVDDAQI